MIEVFDYDTRRYAFREWAQSALETDRLEELHHHHCWGARSPGHRVMRFTERLKDAFQSETRALFRQFVLEYAAPRLPYPPWSEFFPNMRVHENGSETTSHLHRDRDYVKAPRSMKIWLPFTRVSGSGTLWIEGEEGRNDLRPFDLAYGQVLLFDSLNLLHGCRFNDSGSTRVSIDFIVRPDPPRPGERPAG